MVQKSIKRIVRHLRREGFGPTVSRLLTPAKWTAKRDIFKEYDFDGKPLIGTKISREEVDDKTICWILVPFPKGSGGHLNAFRFIHLLEQRGFKCSIVIMGGDWLPPADVMRENIRSWFAPVEAKVYAGVENAPPAFTTVATSWLSAYDVRRIQSTMNKVYFVQDFEPWFSGRGADYVFAEETYKFGFTGITVGDWLSDTLSKSYNMECYPVAYGIETTHLYRRPRTGIGRRRLFFYGRPATPRRAFELGMLVLKRVCESLPGLEVAFAGEDLSTYAIPFPHENHGVLSMEQLGQLYSECDAALVLSMTNLSLLPVELMACGVPVVSNKGPNVEWLLNSRNSILADPTVDSLSCALLTLLNNESVRKELVEEGAKFASTISWDREADKLGMIFNTLRSR